MHSSALCWSFCVSVHVHANTRVSKCRAMNSFSLWSEDIHQTAASSLFVPLNWTSLDRSQVRFYQSLILYFFLILFLLPIEIWSINPTQHFKSWQGDCLWGTTLQSRLWHDAALCMGGMNLIIINYYYSHLNGSVISKLSFFNLIPSAFFFFFFFFR